MPDREREEAIRIAHSPVSEQVVLAASCADDEARAVAATKLPRPDFFLSKEHPPIWEALLEMQRKNLPFDEATLLRIGGDRIDVRYARDLLRLRPDPVDAETLAHHVGRVRWDRQRAVAVKGPVSALVEALRDPSSAPARVAALAKHAAESLSGGGEASFLRDGGDVARRLASELRRRQEGTPVWPYGVPGLDVYEEGARNGKGEDVSGRPRMLPGAAPGQVTVLTALSGSGKSTVVAHLILGLAMNQGRRVLYGAWEPGDVEGLELLTLVDLGWSRTDLTEGNLSSEDVVKFEERAHEIAKVVRIMENPFAKERGQKETNEGNLDLIHQHVADSGCEVFVADMWDYCLVDDQPERVKRALRRQRAMVDEAKVHAILLAQQRLKDVEQRADKRPTREGIMGSSEWVQIADTILALHRPALFKAMEDDKLEAVIWKQRKGPWPLCVEFDWDPEFGSIEGGKSVPFQHVGEQGNDFDAMMAKPKKKRH